MPRTKRTSKTTKRATRATVNPSEDKIRKEMIDKYLKEFIPNCKIKREEMNNSLNIILSELRLITIHHKQSISPRIGNATMEELEKGLVESTYFVTVSESTNSDVLDATSTLKSKKTRKYKRSSSVADDEGYLTSEASNSSGGKRTSRVDKKRVQPARTSRSLSRSNAPQVPSNSNFRTPANKIPRTDFGFVTPKVKPNTPQVILRRPKEGEMAISMQGSPLLVNTIVSREANVNIPLEDGRTISIQPKLGIRLSQLPDIDPSIKRQIEVLRDNLIKVCELAK